ncbi:hypothetical protein KQX54_006828 [Cotesia glomerata]|uniref:Uncharacterized protein n=1 Tax=Cotesia glomerata TaxID=32391 RepID=A0AAV7ISE6_COTGL|nr:hypothetical protein KQX54_006828 [Cotesia glomerata]
MMEINEIKVLGKGVTEIVADNHNLALRRLNIHIDNDSEVQYFKRIIINNEIIHSQAYTKVRKRNNFTVLLSNKEIFEIDIFILVELQGEKECFALGKTLVYRQTANQNGGLDDVNVSYCIPVFAA